MISRGSLASARAMQNALALPPGQLVRITAAVLRRQAHLMEQFLHPRLDRGTVRQPMGDDRLGDGKADGEPGVERGERILEHVLDAAVQELCRTGRQPCDIVAFETDAAGDGLLEPDDAAARGGFPAAGLAHQPKRLARLDGEAHALDGMDARESAAKQAARDVEAGNEILNLQHRLGISHDRILHDGWSVAARFRKGRGQVLTGKTAESRNRGEQGTRVGL